MNDKVYMPIRVKILEHHFSMMVVALQPDGNRALLRHEELSYDPKFNSRDFKTIHELYPIDKEIVVVIIDEEITGQSLPMVSAAAAIHDPWREEVTSWKIDETIKVMVVTDTGHPMYYRGHIMAGVEALMGIEDYHEALGKRKDDSFFQPIVGDRLAGVVRQIDVAHRQIYLSMSRMMLETSLFSEVANDALKPDTLSPFNDEVAIRRSEAAIRIVADNHDMNLRVQLENEFTSVKSLQYIAQPPFKRILVLDDVPSVADSIARYLTLEGFEVVTCTTMAQVRHTLCLSSETDQETLSIRDENLEPIEAAIIDINLEDDPENGKHSGIDLAREMQAAYPRCKIILISGEPLTADVLQAKAEKAAGLLICCFCPKPVGGREILEILRRARAEPLRDAHNVFLELLDDNQPDALQPIKTVDINDHMKSQSNIDFILEDLGIKLDADSVFLFSMHPVTYEINIESFWGQPMGNKQQFFGKLAMSPIRDVCLDYSTDFETWYDTWNDGECKPKNPLFGKHRYLVYCYSKRHDNCVNCRYDHPYAACVKHRYNSCCATRVHGSEGNPLAYSLFAIAMRSYAFDKQMSCYYLELAAERITHEFRLIQWQNIEVENHPFLMTGRSACSLGHDLCNHFQHSINIESALKVIEIAQHDKTCSAAEIFKKIKRILDEAKIQLDFAHDIAKRFTDLARDQNEPTSILPIRDLFDGKKGAITASKPERDTSKTSVYKFEQHDQILLDKNVCVRRSAMVRVFQNILINAAQQVGFRGILAGGIMIDLAEETREIQQSVKQPGIHIDFIDSGPGIHWSNKLDIFKPKYSTRIGGSGMGLHIAKEELEKVKGSIEVVESILGIGTNIRVWLPVVSSPTE